MGQNVPGSDKTIQTEYEELVNKIREKIVVKSVNRVSGPVGTYVHHAGSLHVYTADADRAQAFLDEGFQSTGPTMPAMPPGSPWTLVEQLLVAERSLRKQEDPASVVLPADPYWADLARVLAMLAMLKAGRGSEADAMIQSIETDAYALILRESAERFQQ